MKLITKILVYTAAYITTAATAFAFNLSFLDDTPMSYFNDKDWQIMQDAALKTLNQGKDNVRIKWANPKTQAWGYLTPSNTTTTNGTICRHLTILNNAHGVSEQSAYQFCKYNNEWKVMPK